MKKSLVLGALMMSNVASFSAGAFECTGYELGQSVMRSTLIKKNVVPEEMREKVFRSYDEMIKSPRIDIADAHGEFMTALAEWKFSLPESSVRKFNEAGRKLLEEDLRNYLHSAGDRIGETVDGLVPEPNMDTVAEMEAFEDSMKAKGKKIYENVTSWSWSDWAKFLAPTPIKVRNDRKLARLEANLARAQKELDDFKAKLGAKPEKIVPKEFAGIKLSTTERGAIDGGKWIEDYTAKKFKEFSNAITSTSDAVKTAFEVDPIHMKIIMLSILSGFYAKQKEAGCQ